MQEFMNELFKIRSDLERHGDLLAKKHGLGVQAPPLEAFPMAFNFATVALELTSHYTAAWGAHPVLNLTAEQIEEKRRENGERLVTLSKTTFVWTLSVIEYNLRRAIELYPAVLPTKKKGRNIYFADMVVWSAEAGLIDPARRQLWLGANTIRNKCVHNNGYGDDAANWHFSNDLVIEMQEGRMIEGTIMTFPKLTSWVVGEYADWCDQFLARAKGTAAAGNG